jgi:Glycerophosphoryl diester phosphodiesterase family
MFTIIAHRGDSAAAPENTFAAFDAALAGGFPHIETDVQLTADGVPVLLHDERLGRTLPGEGPISALTLAELQQLDAGAWFGGSSSSSGGGGGSGTTIPGQYAGQRVPTLSDTLQRYDGRAHIHLVRCTLRVPIPKVPRYMYSHAVPAAALAAGPELCRADLDTRMHYPRRSSSPSRKLCPPQWRAC